MNRTMNAWSSMIISGVVVALFFFCSLITLINKEAEYTRGLPAWETQVERTQEHNSFWTNAFEREQHLAIGSTVTRDVYYESWADYDFAWDVYTVHANSTPEAEALYSARSRLLGLAERPYGGTRYIDLGFAAQGSLTEGHLAPSPEFVRKVQRLHTAGLDSVLTQVPPKPEAPVYLPVTVWNWLAVFPRWLVLWVALSWIFYGLHAPTKSSKLASLYDEIVSVPGEPVARAILFVQTFWAIVFFAAIQAVGHTAHASARGINIASDRLREMRHPNRAEIRRARRALKILKADGAAPELVAKAEDLLRQWSVISADEAQAPRRTKPSRREQRLAAAASEVVKLDQELEADREATAAARPPRRVVEK